MQRIEYSLSKLSTSGGELLSSDHEDNVNLCMGDDTEDLTEDVLNSDVANGDQY